MQKIIGVLFIALALVIGIVPVLTDCLAAGRSLTTTNGMSVPMKCHWTALAEIGAAVPLALVGIFSMTSKRKETFRALSGFGGALGALVVLFPTVLIGVCANPAMPCNMIEKPALILSGIIALAASVGILLYSRKHLEFGA